MAYPSPVVAISPRSWPVHPILLASLKKSIESPADVSNKEATKGRHSETGLRSLQHSLNEVGIEIFHLAAKVGVERDAEFPLNGAHVQNLIALNSENHIATNHVVSVEFESFKDGEAVFLNCLGINIRVINTLKIMAPES